MFDTKILRDGLAVSLVAAAVGLSPQAAFSETGVTDDTIKIGTFGVMTGPYFTYGKVMMDGAQIVYNEANAAGGIHGRKIELIREDDMCKPASAIAAVKKLIHQEKVFMINGGGCSNPSLAARPEIEKANIPWVVLTSIGEGITNPPAPYIYTPVLTSKIESRAQFKNAMDRGFKRIAVIASQDAWGRSRYEPLMEEFKKNGMTPVADVEMVDTANDATAQVLKIKQANPDAVLMLLYSRSAAMYMRDAHKLGFKPATIGTSATGDLLTLSKQVGEAKALENLVSISLVNFTPTDPEMAEWRTLFKKYYPGDTMLVNHLVGVGSATVVVEVLKRAGRDLTRDRFRQEIAKLANFRSPVFAGPITCSEKDHQCNKSAGWVKLNIGTNEVVSAR